MFVLPCTCEAAKMSSEERAELKLIEDSCELEGNKWIMKYPWKEDPSSLPDNYAQVLKKLESTKQRLLKEPEHAHSYDMQVKEIEDMKFSIKLTMKEKSKWKGPSHYVSTVLFFAWKRKVHQSELCLAAQHHSKDIR